jgi:type II restriction enzyme
MNTQDLIIIFKDYKKKLGKNAFRHISEILRKAKEIHKRDFKGNDHEQSWRSFKGKNLEKLIEHILILEVEKLGLEILNGNTLERTNETNLSKNLARIKRNLLIDYGEFGYHLPDIDMVIYEPKTCKVIAVISIKVTLRERIAQTGYWKMKLANGELTKHIKVYFITPDEDKTLKYKKPSKKGRAIVEIDTDGGYVLSETDIEESGKVKMFDKFIEDLKKLIDEK